MNDKMKMEELLNITKSACDLYLHGSIESGSSKVHCVFETALCETLKMQNEIYSKMSDKGWYSSEQADAQKIQQVKQKYAMK